jgi:S1-C subfamily serine protease
MRGGSYLGVRLEDVDKDDVARLKLPEEKGALVKRVEDDSPAAKAGLKAGDVIVRYHGEAVLSAAQLARLVRETPPGRTVTLEVARDGAVQNLSATIGGDDRGAWSLGDWGDFDVRIPETVPPVPPVPPLPPRAFERWGKRALLEDLVWPGAGPRRLGIEYTEIHGQLAKYFKLTEDEGVLVTSVDPDGPAAKAGLKAGDVILKIGARSIQDGDDLRRAVRKAEPGRETSLTVLRDGRSLELKLTPAGEGKEPEGTEL